MKIHREPVCSVMIVGCLLFVSTALIAHVDAWGAPATSQAQAQSSPETKPKAKPKAKPKIKRENKRKAKPKAKPKIKRKNKRKAKRKNKRKAKRKNKLNSKRKAKLKNKRKNKRKSKRKAKSKRRRSKRQSYRAVRGDTWSSIAKALKVSLKSLKRWNRKHRKMKRPKPGTRIVFYGPPRKTESIGRAYRGSLKNGVHLDPDGDGLGSGFAVSRSRSALWGTPGLVKLIKRCGRTYRRYFSRRYAPIPIGDLSSRRGGQLKSHKSHQSGRDVDVGYMRKKPRGRGYFVDTSPREMDMYAQWVVVKCFLDDPLTQMIFIERSRVRAIKRYIKRIYKTRPAKLKRYLAYFPRGSKRAIYPDDVHTSHLHVRIRCPEGDKRCVN